MSEAQAFNLYMSFAIKWRIDSVPAIFRDCYNHFPLPPDKLEELEKLKKSKNAPTSSNAAWHWPIPPVDGATIPTIKPRPDKYTFVRAMEYAVRIGDSHFAREVWLHRELWRAHIDQSAVDDFQNERWAEFHDSDIVRYEHLFVDTFTPTRSWAKIAAKNSEKTDGASDTLYEGYTRLLYIQTLASGGHCDEAFAMILRGTGERYGWSQAMLAKVKVDAEVYGHWEMVKYIDSLEAFEPEEEMETLQNDWLE